VAGQVNVVGNVIANNFLGNIVILGNISAPYFLGNLIARGNVDAANVVAGNIRVSGQVNVGGNVIANNFIGNLVSTGNLSAPYFLGNLVTTGTIDAGNVTAANLRVFGQVNVVGNVLGRNFFGNILTTGNVDAGGIRTFDLRANVANIANVTMTGNGVITVPGCISFPYYVGCCYRGTNVSYAVGDFRTCSFLNLVYDPRGQWSGTAFSVPVSGYYLVQFSVFVDAGSYILRAINNSSGAVFAYSERQGGATPARYVHPVCTGVGFLTTGQTISFQVRPINITSCATNSEDFMYVSFLGAS
jgi:cytoskeletal protein CcmA (bactofilin family)